MLGFLKNMLTDFHLMVFIVWRYPPKCCYSNHIQDYERAIVVNAINYVKHQRVGSILEKWRM